MKRIVADDETCPSCDGPIVYWLPDDISITDVPNRIRGATTLPRQEGIDTATPLHPGRYCQAGCVIQLFNFGHDALWERLEAERRQRETASLIVKPVSHKDTPLQDFKIYIDRRLRVQAPRDRGTAPEYCVYLELEPGDHTIVVRDCDYYHHRGPDRKVSNTVQFRIEPHKQIAFSLSLSNGQLQLQLDG